MLIPIVASQFVFDRENKLSVDETLVKADVVLKSTSKLDVEQLVRMKRYALDLCFQFDVPVPVFEVENVWEYYKESIPKFNVNAHPSMFAHNKELVEKFPNVLRAYQALCDSKKHTFNSKCTEAFREIRKTNIRAGRGFLADCIAVAIYLKLAHNHTGRVVI